MARLSRPYKWKEGTCPHKKVYLFRKNKYMYFRSVSKEIALYTAVLGDQKSTKKTRLLAFLRPLMWFLSQTHVKKHSSDPIRALKTIWNQRKRLYMQQERPKSRKNGPKPKRPKRPKWWKLAFFQAEHHLEPKIYLFETNFICLTFRRRFGPQWH